MGCLPGTTTGGCNYFTITRDPTLVFHHERSASGAPLAVGQGTFWLITPWNAIGKQTWHRTQRIDPTLAPWTMGPLRVTIDAMEYGVDGTIALFEDLRTSAMKGGIAEARKVEFMPFADGTFAAQLKDGNDFSVMERGICRGLKTDPETICGPAYPDTF